MDILKYYVDFFNRNDNELFKNDVDNAHAYEWLKEEVPILHCPDKAIEQAYYFRWWTYRKHVKSTEDGYIITEFLPKVPWSGRYNEINAAVGHHLCEGRWLKNGKRYLTDYVRFFLDNPDRGHQYSAWMVDALWQMCAVTGDYSFGVENLNKLTAYYDEWERTHGLPDGTFWSIDNYDAMEYSISGTGEDLKPLRGIRPTLNSYMCADAYAISRFAELAGKGDIAKEYREKGDRLKKKINEVLFEDGFYRAYHYKNEDELGTLFEDLKGSQPRELIGYIPWAFDIPEKGREEVFGLLDDPDCFYSDYGITTAERSHPRYLYDVKHECLWNGYVWPFATSQTLNALNRVIRHYSDDSKYKKLFFKLLKQYAESHHRVTGDGTSVPWIDENRHPEYDEWTSREILWSWYWPEKKGGEERGKDYNHSTFCDLVISGLLGVSADADGNITVEPNVPDSWKHFTLDDLWVCGKCYRIEYRDGKTEVICK